MKRLDVAIAIFLGLLSFLLYLTTLAPTLLFADGGEFQFVPYILGICHPTGYPLYLLLGWLWSHFLPWGEVAFRMNLFSALWGSATIALLYLVGERAMEIAGIAEPPYFSRSLAALASLVFATSRTFWSQAVIAEVYTFNTFFVALTLLLLLLWSQRREKRFLYLFSLAYGLSLTHHRTMALLAPAYLLFIWFTDRTILRQPRTVALSLLLLLPPQLLYLYIPLRAPATPYTTIELAPGHKLLLYENSWQGFLRLTMGQAYGSRLGLYGTLPQILAGAFRFLQGEFLLPGIVLGLLGLLSLLRAPRLFLLLLLSYASIFLFCLLHFRGDIKVFFIPTYLIFALWIGFGGTALSKGVSHFSQRWKYLIYTTVFLLLALLPFTLLVRNYPSVDRSQDFLARDFWEGLLSEPIPQGAILATNDRNEMMPLWYRQQVEGVRTDLIGVFPLIVPDEGYENIGALLDSIFGLGRPLYLIKEMPGLEIKYRFQRWGSLLEVISPAATGEPQHPRHLILGDSLALVGYDQEPPTPRPGDELRIALYWRPQQEVEENHSTYVHLVDRNGQAIAGSDHQPGGVYYPTSLWREGETLRDEHILIIPSSAPLGAYSLLVGMYETASEEPLGEGLIVGKVGVKSGILTSPGEMETELGANFGDRVTLLGYDLQRWGNELNLTLYWRAEQEMEEDYTIFVHLLRGEEIVAQADSQPQEGNWPTSIWDQGEVMADEHRLTIEGLPRGRYQLEAGLYLLETMERLPVLDAQGKAVSDKVNLASVEVK